MDFIIQALENVDFSTNSRTSTYYNNDGKKVPRVTEILSSMIHSDSLMYWANTLGMKGERYKDVLNRAADIGTKAYAAIERFLKANIITGDDIPFRGFLMWYNIIKDNNIPVEVIYVEHQIVSKWFGGTLDVLIKIGSKVYLLDFKTSNHITYKYFLQLSAYRYSLREVENINIDGVIVLQLEKDEPGFKEYLLSFDNPEHLNFINNCEACFLSLTYSYFCTKNIEKQFNKIF